jgi:hypothetical protein
MVNWLQVLWEVPSINVAVNLIGTSRYVIHGSCLHDMLIGSYREALFSPNNACGSEAACVRIILWWTAEIHGVDADAAGMMGVV